MKIAVTGGNGRLGRALVNYLADEGHQVVSIDRQLPNQPWGGPGRPRFFVADTRDYGDFLGCLRECEALIHLAAYPSPMNHADMTVYNDNTVGSYNALSAAATLGINRVCMASSINAIGGAFSLHPHYDYFPVDEKHPTYAEDAYSLSKWVLEQQGDAFARRFPQMQIASLRFHSIVESRDQYRPQNNEQAVEWHARHLWGYSLIHECCRACLLSVTADFSGHEAFYIVAPDTTVETPSAELAARFYPEAVLHQPMPETTGFFDCSKAERLLGWKHP